MERFEKFWYEQVEWSRKTFGTSPPRGPVGPLKHLAKEIDEILEDPRNITEYVDAMFLLIDAAWRAGFEPTQFLNKCFEKLEINKQRQWNAPTSDEPVEHVRKVSIDRRLGPIPSPDPALKELLDDLDRVD